MTLNFSSERAPIVKILEDYFNSFKNQNHINDWEKDSLLKLEKLVLKGKLLRGGLIAISSTENKVTPKSAYRLAAMLEIFHSAFLIHDDIMDQSDLRRGEQTAHLQYKNQAIKEKITKPDLFGTSMAINLGNLGFFLAFDLLNKIKLKSETRFKVTDLLTKEFAKLGVGQMQDIFLSLSPYSASEKEILDMYKYKTARYSFVLPLRLGLLLSDSKNNLPEIDQLGEILGLIYQIKDDEVNLFQDSEVSGKSSATDLILKKKTLHYIYLLKTLNSEQLKKLNRILKSQPSKKDLEFIKSLLLSKGIVEKVSRKVSQMANNYNEILSQSSLDKNLKSILKDLITYFLNRNAN